MRATREALAIAVALAIVVVGSQIGIAGGLVATAVSCLLLAWFFRMDAAPLVLATLPASALIASNLLSSETQYLPLGAVIAALGVTVGFMVARRRLVLTAPSREIGLLVLAYCAWAAIAAIGSTDLRLGAVYTVGIVVTVTLAFIVMPSVLGSVRLRGALLVTIGVVAVLAAMAGFVLAVVGPIWWTSRPLGLYAPIEIVLFGNPTGIVIPRITGIYAVPSYQAIALALGLVAMLALAWRPSRAALLASAVVAFGLFLTLDRSGWLIAGLGCAGIVACDLPRRHVNIAPVLVAVAFFALLGGLTTNAVEGIGRYDVACQRYGDIAGSLPVFNVSTPCGTRGPAGSPAPGALPGNGVGADDAESVVVRGGSQLGARMILWSASFQALAERPLIGFGPGSVASAIGPFLTGEASAYRGLTSHNTWLRTAVEMGIPSMLFLGLFLAVLLAQLLLAVRKARSRPLVASFALLVGLLGALMFESFLFGGLAYPSFAWTMAAGLGAAELVEVAWRAGPGPRLHPDETRMDSPENLLGSADA